MEAIFLGKDYDDWRPQFPKPEEITITNVDSDNDLEREKIIVEKILDGSPNFCRICALRGNLKILEIFPDNKLALLEKLELNLQRFAWKEEELVRKVVAPKPRLKELEIELPWSDEPSSLEESDNFHGLVQQLLQNSHESLKRICFQNPYPSQCKFLTPQLMNLTKLEFWSEDIKQADQFWEQFVPQVEDVYKEISSIAVPEWPKLKHSHEPENNILVNRSCCNKTIRLDLHLHVRKVNMSLIQTVFPNVFNLNVMLYGTVGTSTPDEMPFQGVFENWPALEVLRFAVDRNILSHNLDSEICGINAEEVELLWEMHMEDLKAVHIVPIRPSILTMPNLRNLEMSMGFLSISVRMRPSTSYTQSPWFHNF